MENPNEYSDKNGNLIRILGMTGLMFSDSETQEQFLVSSEVLVGNDYRIAIFQDDIWYCDKTDKRVLLSSKKKEIIAKVLEVLKSNDFEALLL